MMRFARIFFILISALCFISAPAMAETVHGLAMHGTPKYAAGFDHLDYVNQDAPKGGELKLSKNGTFNNLNNHVIIGNNAEGLEYINDKLMQRVWDEPFTLYGLAAEKADIAPDRSWVIFHLNKNARFHDGQPMTAEDVKFSYEMYRKHGHPVRRRVYGLVSDIKIIDSKTIKFTFGEGYDRESVMILALMPVLPKHYWEKHDITKTTLTPPLGSGPYKIESVDPGRKIIYTRVKDYWAKDLGVNKGQYNFDTLTYIYFRDDDIAFQAFKSGEYDLRREYDVTKWETGYKFKSLDEGRVKREEITHGRPEWLRAMVFNTRRPQFSDRRVREALSYMFNYEWLNQNLYFGALKKIDSAYPNSELAAQGRAAGEELQILTDLKKDLPPDVFGEPFKSPPNPGSRESQRKAIALLKEAGWQYKNQRLVNSVGALFNFEILLDSPGDEKIALEFVRALKKIGIQASVRTVDSAQFTGRLESFDYDMVFFKWINSLSPGNEQVNYWGSKAAATPGSRNYAGISNPAIDVLADSIARSKDRDGLVARTRALDRALMYGYYMIPLFYTGRDMVAYDAHLIRPEVTPVYGMVLESWWKKESD
jgi:ABC-type oligopeptide transport system substrate-binding subunit